MANSVYKNSQGNWLPSGEEFICGWGAASINIVVTFPLNKIQFRQQLHGIKTHTAFRQIQREGLLHIYRGMMSPFLQKTSSVALMFGMYDANQRVISHYFPVVPQTANKVTSGLIAGCTEAILCPFERVQILMQDKKFHDHYKNTFHSFKELRQFGVREYYRGLQPIVFRNSTSSALFFLGREHIMEYFPKTVKHGSTEIALNFLSGAVLGSSISTLFYPVNVVKTRMQSQVGGEYKGFFETFWVVYNERQQKMRKMFRGVHINFTRALVSWGITNAAYELIKDWINSR